MKRRKVSSSNIKSVGYDDDLKVLEVEFHGGAVYRYSGVPSKVHRALMAAKSIGTELHKLVRPFFKAELQPSEEKTVTSVDHSERVPKASSSPVKSHIRAHRIVRVSRY